MTVLKKLKYHFSIFFLILPFFSWSAMLYAQPFAGPPLAPGPWFFDTYEEDNIKLSVIARGLDHPFGMAFIPETGTSEYPLGSILFSERSGKVRLFRNGQLESDEIVDLAAIFSMEQLFDLELHPQFDQNGLVYFSYIKTAPHPNGSDDYWVTTALGRGRFDGEQLLDLEDVFVAQAWSNNIGGASSRLHFLTDGTLLLGVSHRIDRQAPQSLDSHIGKVLRLNDDGSVPGDNPFVGVEGALAEIYTLGNRSVMDFSTHPETGEIWELENGPQGGDEVNILRPSLNYGWPIATYGRDYDGTLFNPRPWIEGTELPEIYWVPSITVAGMDFYSGDKFPNWQGSLFVTSMVTGRVFGTGHLERVVFNEYGETMREQLLNNLQQRIRYVREGADGFIYLLTDASDGAFLRMEPASTQISTTSSSVNEELLFPNNDCGTCHRTEGILVGPSFQDISNRYALNEPNIELLAGKIISGGGGAWGEVPMAPHVEISQSAAREMAARVLGLMGD